MNTLLGLFESRAKARQAKGALIRAHIASPNIVLYDRSAADSSGQSQRTLWEALKFSSAFAHDRRFYEEGMRRGGTVVSVRIKDEQTNQAAEILSRHGAIELDPEGADSRTSGDSADTENEAPAAGEKPRPGEREVLGGKVRVYKEAA